MEHYGTSSNQKWNNIMDIFKCSNLLNHRNDPKLGLLVGTVSRPTDDSSA